MDLSTLMWAITVAVVSAALTVQLGEATSTNTQTGNGNKLLLIVLDGHRWDYQTYEYPGFHHMKSNGVEAESLRPSFPTLTMPNLQSITTGLYPEVHAMTGDYMYDTESDQSFSNMHNSTIDSEPRWWNSGDPIWISATRQNRRTYMYYWPGCDVFIHGIKPTFCKPLHDWSVEFEDFKHAANESLQLFANDTADFIGIFYTEPDKTGHNYGTDAQALQQPIQPIDSVIAQLQKDLDTVTVKGKPHVMLKDVTDVMVASTHGMINISPNRVVNATAVLNMTEIKHYIADYTLVQIWPNPGLEEQVLRELNGSSLHHVRVYRKQDIPEELYYKRGQYTAPIIMLAEPGYTILTAAKPTFPTYKTGTASRLWAGNHGYSNQNKDMNGIFVAVGPHFQKNKNYSELENVNLYQIMSAILGIESEPHNGTWSSIQDMVIGLSEPGKYSYPSHIPKIVVGLIALAVIFAVGSVSLGLYCQREGLKNWFRHRGAEWQPLHDGVV